MHDLVWIARIAARLPVTMLLALTICAAYLASGGHDDQRHLQIGFLVLATAVTIVVGRLAAHPLPSFTVGLALSGVVLCGLVSSLNAYSPVHGIQELVTLVLLTLAGLWVAQEMRDEYASKLIPVLLMIGISSALYFVQIIVVWCASIALQSQPDAYTFAPSFGNYRFLNHAQTIALPLLALLCCLSTSRWRKGCLLLAACWWSLLFVLAGRGTFFGLLAGCIVVLCLRRAHARAFCIAMAKGALGGLLIYLVFFVCIPLAVGMAPFGVLTAVVERSAADPASSRLLLWTSGLELVAAQPGLGVGPMHYAHAMKDVVRFAHPHNWPIQIAAEWGIPAFMLLCFVLVRAICGLIRQAACVPAEDLANRTIASAWIVTGVAILVDGLVSGLIVMPVSQLLIILYLGCATGWYSSMQSAARSSTSRSRRLCMASLYTLLTGAIVICLLIKPSDSGLPTDTKLYPRYWLNGHF